MRAPIVFASAAVAACLGTATAMAANIMDGTYISLSYYNGGALGSYSTSPGINYTSGVTSSANVITDPASPAIGAAASANLNTDSLYLATTGSDTYTTATAEMWDSLTLAGPLPSGATVNTTVGSLNMTVTTSAGTSISGISASSAFGLQIFNTATFAQPTAGVDCGAIGGTVNVPLGGGMVETVVFTNPCAASMLAQNTNGGSLETSGVPFGGAITNANASYTYNLSVPLTGAELLAGVSYIAEIAVNNTTGASLTTPLVVDPSISFSSNYAGLTLSSTSGINYQNPPSPVPVPATAWLFGSGLLAVFWASRRTKLTV